MCKIEAKPFNITIIQCYAPTTDHPEKEVEEFYSQIEEALKQTNSQDMVIILGDFNAKVGKTATSTSIGKYGLGKTNERGELLIGFCEKHQLTIMNTIFKQPERRLYTWKSAGDVTRNQIDYIMISSRHKNNIKNCRTYPGADIGSDHNPVIANMKVKLKIPKRPKMTPKIDVAALKQPDLKEAYNIEIRNRFSALMGERENGENIENPIERINCKWN